MIRRILLLLLIISIVQSQNEEDLKRPYKFGFNIENMQHRQEEKDEKGIIMGEYGYITADGWYVTTIYATDEQGRFIILGKKRERVGPPGYPYSGGELPARINVPVVSISSTTPVPTSTPRPFVKPVPVTVTTYKPTLTTRPQLPPIRNSNKFEGLPACGSCVVPTTTTTTKSTNDDIIKPTTIRPNVNTLGIFGIQKPLTANNRNDKFTPENIPNNIADKIPFNKPINIQKPSGFKPNNGPFDQTSKLVNNNNNGFDKIMSVGTTPTPIVDNNRRKYDINNPSINNVNKNFDLISTTKTTMRPIVVPDFDNNDLNYKFKYLLGFQGHEETGYKDGSKTGNYFVNTRDGYGHQVTYQANEHGYQPMIKQVKLSDNDTPREDTEQQIDRLKEYQFVWFK